MSSTTTEQIKEKLDVVTYLREFLTLTPAGKNFKANCPFHKEKTPSFMVSPDRQSWHCFGCGLGGDIFAFLMRHENIEFGEALRMLAEKAGVEMRRLNPAEYKLTGLLHELNAVAKNFFIDQLQTSSVALQYLRERGLAEETIRTFEIGFAPNDREALNMYLLQKRYSPADILRAGLVFKTERGSVFDRFRGRIMFPIHDHFGKCVGFTGRVLPQYDDGKMGKYVNSPETQVFNKSKLLYGYHLTKQPIRDAGWVLLVEGQMDLVMSYQAGVRNVAASSGTALTGDHLRTLRRATDRLMIAFDSDSAGLEATERAIDLALTEDFAVKIVRLSGYKDPADAAQAGADVLKDIVRNAVPAPEFYFEKYLPAEASAKAGLPVNRRDRSFLVAVRAVLRKLLALSPVERDEWMRELSRRLGMEERVLREEAERLNIPETPVTTGGAPEVPSVQNVAESPSRWDLLSERLVAACVARADFAIADSHAEHLSPDYRMIHELLRGGAVTAADERIATMVGLVSLRADAVSDAEIAALKDHLHREHMKVRRGELRARIKQAEARGDEAELAAALTEIQELPTLLSS